MALSVPSGSDAQMRRYVESLTSTISSLTKKLELLEGKMNNNENNYILTLKKMTDLEHENQDMRRAAAANNEKYTILEVN
jgi:hypothetical protein